MVMITYILSAVILLGLCIFVHELGHLLGGKMVGIKAEVFSIGYGKGILKKKIGDTTYQITLIPFGGYCKFYGEDPSEERKGESHEFLTAHPLKRVVVVIMGPLFNLFFGILLFFMMNLVGYSTETNRVYIPDLFKSGDYISPAYNAGMRTGDRIIAIDGESINSFSQIQSGVVFSDGRTLNIQVLRDGAKKTFSVQPKKYSTKGYYTVGVMPYGERVLVIRTLMDDRAQKAGIEEYDEIKAVNGRIIRTPKDFTDSIRMHGGKEIALTIIRRDKEIVKKVTPRFKEEIVIEDFEDARFRGEKSQISISNEDKIGLVKAAIPQKRVKINGKVIHSFQEFISVLERNRGRRIKLENGAGVFYGVVEYKRYGFIGVETAIAPEMVFVSYGIADGLSQAIVEPFDFIVMNLKGLGMLISGKLDVRQNLSGPIRIAKIAGDTAHYRGVSAFIILMAKISVILMVMNLLPIPVVDGSFILFFLYEAIKGSPINQKVMEKIQFVGIVLLIMIGIFVIFNDLSFLPFFQNLFN
jgi:regulator of sigma E protease